MLQFLCKYTTTITNKKIINKNFKKNQLKYKQLFIHINSVVCETSLFWRKSFFRTLLTYVNFQYSNINLEVDNNFFYYPKTVNTYLYARHLSFLPKKYFIK